MRKATDFSGRVRALDALNMAPSVSLAHYPTPVEELARLRDAVAAGDAGGPSRAARASVPRLFVKRDDAISFAFGGNKVRKVELVAPQAIADGADTLITTGGAQSNHARVTAAAAARLGLKCVLVLNGTRPSRLTGNALLDSLYGAEVQYVERREDRAPAMAAAAERLRAEGRRPVEIPLGASTPLGAMGMARAVGELLAAGLVPDVIVHSTSSGGTQAGLVAGCALHGLPTRVLGISADTPSDEMKQIVSGLLDGIGERLGLGRGVLSSAGPIDVDDTFVGDGYGVPTEASQAAAMLLARTQALVVDQTYTAKALAGLLALIREGRFEPDETVMFWHTGGQVAVFA
jgi:1-aminocyclopropane-1-carboxylate deaminase/D-cysteine desulfhydrase-like pyridoxal-dependent ACC family enzyme